MLQATAEPPIPTRPSNDTWPTTRIPRVEMVASEEAAVSHSMTDTPVDPPTDRYFGLPQEWVENLLGVPDPDLNVMQRVLDGLKRLTGTHRPAAEEGDR